MAVYNILKLAAIALAAATIVGGATPTRDLLPRANNAGPCEAGCYNEAAKCCRCDDSCICKTYVRLLSKTDAMHM